LLLISVSVDQTICYEERLRNDLNCVGGS